MNKLKASFELKAEAKESLLGNYTLAIPALLMISIFSLLINNLSTSIYQPGESILSLFLFLLFSIISSLLLEVFSIGKAHLFLNLMTHRDAKLNDIYKGFTIDPKRSLLMCGIYVLLLELTGYLPFYIFQKFFKLDASIGILLSTSLFLIVGLIISAFIILSFSLIFYLINDFPSISALDTLKYSHNLMKGNKIHLFYIYVSFIPWFLLCVLTFGIALFWIMPYLNSTITLFYLDLIEKQ